MTLNEYLSSKTKDSDRIRQIKASLETFLFVNFSASFATELSGYLEKAKFNLKSRKDDVVAMTYSNTEIMINTNMFFARSTEEQMAYITHELIHISERKGNHKVKTLNRKLWDFYNTNKIPGTDVSMVMVGKPRISRRWVNKHECVNYLLTEKVHFEYLEPGSYDEFMGLLEKSGLFKLNSQFWRKRLSFT